MTWVSHQLSDLDFLVCEMEMIVAALCYHYMELHLEWSEVMTE